MITTNAGAGTLAVHIEGTSKLAIVCTELDDGYEFTYTPMSPGNYMIIVKYCSVTIAGCPFKAVVTGTGRSMESVNSTDIILECGPMPNLMVALPNIGGALCSTPQNLADAHY